MKNPRCARRGGFYPGQTQAASHGGDSWPAWTSTPLQSGASDAMWR